MTKWMKLASLVIALAALTGCDGSGEDTLGDSELVDCRRRPTHPRCRDAGSSTQPDGGGLPPSDSGSPAPAPTVGNLWVSTTPGTCTRHATPGPYVASEACSWNDAYQASATGDMILVKGGSYGDVRIYPGRDEVTGVTFQTASGESVAVSEFNNGDYHWGVPGASHVTFIGPVSARTFYADYTDGVTVDGWDVSCGGEVCTQPFHVAEGSHNFTLRNSRVHDAMNPNAMFVIGGDHFTIDHNEIYNDLNNTEGVIHDECIRFQDLRDVVFTRNHVWSCNVMDIFVTNSTLSTNILIENNVFEAPTGSIANSHNAIFFSATPDNVALRYNTFGSSGVTITSDPTSRGMSIVGNYFAVNSPCGLPNTTYGYNATPTGISNCGGPGAVSFSESVLNAGFVTFQPYTGNGGSTPQPPGDYHLVAGSPLIDVANAADYPALDRDGTSRFVGRGPDVGAYETR